jgi:cytidylate kinase
MPEDRIPELTGALDELLGVHPPVWTFVQQTAETILRLADRGNAIIIGRGAHVVTSKLEYVFHVRLVGSLDRRIEHIQEVRGVGSNEALELIRREDRGRQRYLKKYLGKDIDDPLSYHLIINTDFVSYERAARLIGEVGLDYIQVDGCEQVRS